MEFNNKIIIQFGTTNALSADSSTITFPKAFTKATQAVCVTQRKGGGSEQNAAVTSRTVSTFVLYAQSGERSSGFHWISVGY